MSMQETSQNSAALEALWHVREGGAGCGVGGGEGGTMWRRVSCEQLLDTSQSILRLRGSLNQTFGDFIILRETKS